MYEGAVCSNIWDLLEMAALCLIRFVASLDPTIQTCSNSHQYNNQRGLRMCTLGEPVTKTLPLILAFLLCQHVSGVRIERWDPNILWNSPCFSVFDLFLTFVEKHLINEANSRSMLFWTSVLTGSVKLNYVFVPCMVGLARSSGTLPCWCHSGCC